MDDSIGYPTNVVGYLAALFFQMVDRRPKLLSF